LTDCRGILDMRFLGELLVHGVLWSFLPQLITKILLHQIYYRVRGTRPDRSSLKYKNHYRNMFIIVICCYIIGSLTNSFKNMQPNLYQEFGIHRMDTDRDLKNTYRQLAKAYHPDKSTQSMTSSYLKKKEIYEILSDGDLRRLYDDFGPSVLSTSKQFSLTKSKIKDILYSGLIELGIFYLASMLFILFSRTNGAFWRFFLLIFGITVELWVVLRAPWSTASWWNMPHWLGSLAIFEHLKIFRQVVLLTGLAINQLYPLLVGGERMRENNLPSLEKMIQDLYKNSEEMKKEAEEIFYLELNSLREGSDKELSEKNRLEAILANAQKSGILPKKDKTA